MRQRGVRRRADFIRAQHDPGAAFRAYVQSQGIGPEYRQAVLRSLPDNCYATLFLGEYDPSSGRLHYVNAGHEPPFVLRRQGKHFQTLFLEASGPVIGMLRESSYRESVVALRPGDVLVAYTDGLCKCANHSGEEWGWQRLLKAVEDCADERAYDIVEGVMRSADAFAGGAAREDDVTLFVGRIQEPISERPRWQRIARLWRWRPDQGARRCFNAEALRR